MPRPVRLPHHAARHRLVHMSPPVSAAYSAKLIAAFGPSLIAYWPLWEGSGTIAYDQSIQLNNGVQSGAVGLGQPGIGDSRTSYHFDGVADFVDVYSAALNADFTGGQFTVCAWCKVQNAAVWTDGLSGNVLRLEVDANNNVLLSQDAANNTFRIAYAAGVVGKTINTARSDLGWLHSAMTVSASADEMKAFIMGLQVGATQTGLGVWAGALSSGKCTIGSRNSVAPTALFPGWIAHVAVGNAALAPSVIASLAQV